MSVHEFRTYFDLVDANGLVPELELCFAELARIQQQVNALSRAAEAAGVRLDIEGAFEGRLDEACAAMPSIGARLKELSEKYLDVLDDIADMGVVICDVDMGLVGFFAWFGGQEIFLSWQYGEPEVAHWHGVTENPDDRRSLAELFSKRRALVSLH